MKTHFFVKHWVAAFAIAVLTVVIGGVSLTSLSVEQYPDIAPPMVTIQATYSGADAHAVMESVIMPLEEVVNGVENMIYMDATATSNGEGEIDIYFKQGTNADNATVNVQNRVSQASGVLPEDVIRNGVTVEKNVNATLMIMSLESTDEQFDQSFISNYLDINVMPAISRIAGVGRTMVMGEQYGVRIWLKPDLMGLYGVTPDEIVDAINEQNLVVPIGRLESATDKIDIEFNGLLDDMSQFENIIIRATDKGEVLRLRDLAEVELGAKAYDFRTNISGKPGVMFYVKLAPGTYLDETEATTVELEEYIKTLDEVETVGALTGYSMMEDVTSTNYATLMVRLKNWDERGFFSIADIQKDISDWATINLPQADVTAFQMPQIPGYGNGSDISFSLQDLSRSANKKDFVAMGEQFVKKLDERPETEFASSTNSTDFPKYRLSIDKIACKRMGVSPKTVLQTIGTFLAGDYIGSYVQYNNVYRVMVQAGKEYRMSEAMLNSIFVPVGDHMVPVTQFVTMRLDTGSAMDLHFNLFPSYPVSTLPAPGYTSDDVRKAVDEVKREVFPETFGYEYSGMAREEAENANSNETLFIYSICMLLIYLIMACLYDSLFIPLAVMLSIPFALFGAYLFIIPMESMGVGANVYVQTGIIMMIGLVAKTAILITEFAVQKRREGMSILDAAIGACQDRLRPILMTVLTMILGMLPLAVGSGAGAVGNRSLALAVIGGMTIGTIALLFVTPAFYMVFQKVHEKLTPSEENEA